MKKSNFFFLGLSAIAAAFLLFLWYWLGFNHIDNPLDLVLAILWWVGIVVIALVITKLEKNRRRQIRTIYVSPTALYNSEKGVVGLKDQTTVDAMEQLLQELEYNFNKEDLPEQKKFDYRYVVQTDEYKESDDDDKEKEPTWKGTVTKIVREGDNVETEFDDIDQLKAALAA